MFSLGKGRKDGRAVMFCSMISNDGNTRITMTLTSAEMAGIIALMRGDLAVQGREEKIFYTHSGDNRPTTSLSIQRPNDNKYKAAWFVNLKKDSERANISLTDNEATELGLFFEMCLPFFFNLQPLPQDQWPVHYNYDQ